VSAFFSRNHLFVVGILLLTLALPPQLCAQYVDCSGNDPNAFPSITAALVNATPGSWITVVGTCNENVYITNQNTIGISALWQQTATINGSVSIQNSENVNLYGLNVTNAAGDGIQIGHSRGIILDTCSSNGNAGKGLTIGPASDLNINATGSFSNNGDNGITIGDLSSLQILAWGGLVTISGNKNAGIYASSGSSVEGLGNIVIENTFGTTVNGLISGFGIDLRGHSSLQMGTVFGSNVIQNNHSGGVSLQENAEASFWGGSNLNPSGLLNIIQNNGDVGIVAGFGTQVTLFDSVNISGHADYGVDLYANSQLYAYGKNQFIRNATGTELLRSAVRVDGNSEAYFRGGQFLQNGGPAITALVNSSIDLTGATFQGNAGGILTCDLTSVTVGDLAPQFGNSTAVRCRAAHNFGSAGRYFAPPHIPDLSPYQGMHDRWRKSAKRQ
jgi:hypothetical protein